MSDFLTIPEAAFRLGVSKVAVYQAVKEERMPSTVRYGRILVLPDDVDAYARTVGKRNGYRKRKR
jgi:excisionase family DNA binding protein